MPAAPIATPESVRAVYAKLIAVGITPSVRKIALALKGGSPNRILAILQEILAESGVVPASRSIPPSLPSRVSATTLRVGSLCSGLDAPLVALGRIGGWTPAWCAEVDDAASAVLRHRHHAVPISLDAKAAVASITALHKGEIPNLRDITRPDFVSLANQTTGDASLDLICGGPPCVAWSLAGKRHGIASPEGMLTLRFVELVRELKPRVIFFENVSALLSADSNTFGQVLAALGGLDGMLITPRGVVL